MVSRLPEVFHDESHLTRREVLRPLAVVSCAELVAQLGVEFYPSVECPHGVLAVGVGTVERGKLLFGVGSDFHSVQC